MSVSILEDLKKENLSYEEKLERAIEHSLKTGENVIFDSNDNEILNEVDFRELRKEGDNLYRELKKIDYYNMKLEIVHKKNDSDIYINYEKDKKELEDKIKKLQDKAQFYRLNNQTYYRSPKYKEYFDNNEELPEHITTGEPSIDDYRKKLLNQGKLDILEESITLKEAFEMNELLKSGEDTIDSLSKKYYSNNFNIESKLYELGMIDEVSFVDKNSDTPIHSVLKLPYDKLEEFYKDFEEGISKEDILSKYQMDDKQFNYYTDTDTKSNMESKMIRDGEKLDGLLRKKNLEFSETLFYENEGSTPKYYHISLKDGKLDATFGYIGTDGDTISRDGNADDFNLMIKDKKNKGYVSIPDSLESLKAGNNPFEQPEEYPSVDMIKRMDDMILETLSKQNTFEMLVSIVENNSHRSLRFDDILYSVVANENTPKDVLERFLASPHLPKEIRSLDLREVIKENLNNKNNSVSSSNKLEKDYEDLIQENNDEVIIPEIISEENENIKAIPFKKSNKLIVNIPETNGVGEPAVKHYDNAKENVISIENKQKSIAYNPTQGS